MDPKLWARLSESARYALIKQAEVLADGHSGSIELQCFKGGVRLIRVGKEYRPGEHEYHLGEPPATAPGK